MGGAGRAAGAGVGSGFVAGVLIGVALVVFVAPPPPSPGVAPDQGRSLAQNESTSSNSLRGANDELRGGMSTWDHPPTASSGACASALTLEQSRRSVLTVNLAGLEAELKTLRNNRGCDAVCKQAVSAQPFRNHACAAS